LYSSAKSNFSDPNFVALKITVYLCITSRYMGIIPKYFYILGLTL